MNNHFAPISRFIAGLLLILFQMPVSAQSPLDALPPVDSLSDAEVAAWAGRLDERAVWLKIESAARQQEANANKDHLETELAAAKADSTLAATVVDSIGKLLKNARNLEKAASKTFKQAEKTGALTAGLLSGDSLYQRKNLQKTWKAVRELEWLLYPEEAAKTTPTPKAVKPQKEIQKEAPLTVDAAAGESLPPGTAVTAAKQPPKSTQTVKKYSPALDVMLNPPAIPCAFDLETRDEFSGAIYRRTVAVELFRHTPQALKAYLAGKPNVRCNAALASDGTQSTLLLTFIIQDPNPRKAFGKLDKNSQATLWFMDGSSFVLYNQRPDEGFQNPEDQSLIYQGQYLLNAEVLKKMKRNELDKVRIAWGSGYEDYEVHFVQLFMQLSDCFK